MQNNWRLENSFFAMIRQKIRENHRKPLLGLLASISQKYLRAYYNEGFYEFHKNGEDFVIRSFVSWRSGSDFVVWDVGANAGQWAGAMAQAAPGAMLHSFEILPPIASEFEKLHHSNPNIRLHRIGLSESERAVDVTWNRDCDEASSIDARRFGGPGGNVVVQRCKVTTVDRLIENGIEPPNFLKIDTEGHDAAVLRGASALLASDNAPDLIQFEYGETWIPPRETLEQCYSLLNHHGYRLGRLYPNFVAFKDYQYSDDDFRMGNMIAAKNPDLIAILNG